MAIWDRCGKEETIRLLTAYQSPPLEPEPYQEAVVLKAQLVKASQWVEQYLQIVTAWGNPRDVNPLTICE